MRSPFKNPKNNEKGTNQSLHEIIYKKVTAENYQENQDETFEECKRLFKQGASPKKLAELKEVLKARQDEQAIAKHLELSKQGASPEASAKLEKSVGKKREHYNNYIQHFLPALKAKITKSKKLNPTKKTEIEKIIMELITLDVVSKSSSVSSIPSAVKENIEDQMQLGHIEKQNNTQETPLNIAEKKSGDNKILGQLDIPKEVSRQYSEVMEQLKKNIKTPKLGNGSGSDSGIDLPELSEENSISPINSRRNSLTSIASISSEESLNSTLSSTEKDNNSYKEETEQSEQTAEEERKMQENENSGGQEGKISSQVEVKIKSNGEESEPALLEEEPKFEEQKKKAVLSKQEASNNQNNSEVKQPNNRNLYVALAAGCALLAVGCVAVAAKKESQIFYFMGAVLFVTAAMLAITTAVTWYLTPPSSELTSTNLSRPVDDKKFTECSVM